MPPFPSFIILTQIFKFASSFLLRHPNFPKTSPHFLAHLRKTLRTFEQNHTSHHKTLRPFAQNRTFPTRSTPFPTLPHPTILLTALICYLLPMTISVNDFLSAAGPVAKRLSNF